MLRYQPTTNDEARALGVAAAGDSLTGMADIVERGYRGAVRSLAGRVAGTYGAIGIAGLIEGNHAITENRTGTKGAASEKEF